MQDAPWHAHVAIIRNDLVLVRQAQSPEGRAQLVRAALVLRGVECPQSERFIAYDERKSLSVLMTQFVGERSIQTHPPCTMSGIHKVGVEVAGLCNMLHRTGRVHGPISPKNLVYNSNGNLVLCGFQDGLRKMDVQEAHFHARTVDDRRSLASLLAHLTSVVTPGRTLSPAEIRAKRHIDVLITQLRHGFDGDEVQSNDVPGVSLIHRRVAASMRAFRSPDLVAARAATID